MALDISSLTKQYREKLPEYEHTRNSVDLLIRRYKDTTGKDIVRSYSSRLKEETRFLKKAAEKGASVKNVWDQIFDILGFRIVVLFSDDIARIEDEFVKEHFTILEVKRYEWTELDPKSKTFIETRKVVEEGYTSIHYVVRLKDPHVFNAKDWPFEIQCRTILEDAWAEFSHELYTIERVPQEIKLDLVMLSRYIKVFNDHFQAIRDNYLSLRPYLLGEPTTDLHGADLSGKEFFHKDFSGYNLRNVNFSQARLLFCRLDNADLTGASLNKASLVHAKMRGAKVVNADLSSADLAYADLTGANLSSSNLEKCQLSYADLTHATLNGIKGRYLDLSFATIKGTTFRDADLREAHLVFNYYFEEADLATADITGALVAKRETGQA